MTYELEAQQFLSERLLMQEALAQCISIAQSLDLIVSKLPDTEECKQLMVECEDSRRELDECVTALRERINERLPPTLPRVSRRR